MIVILLFTLYVVLDTFVLTSVYKEVDNLEGKIDLEKGKVISNDEQYEDDNIKISLKTYNEYNTYIYVADITLSENSLLKTAFAKSSYGKNITDKTSSIAKSVDAILAINGDYYGVQESWYVLKNGIIYRNKAKSGRQDLVIYKDGSFEIINETDITLEELLEKGAYNVLSFGPALIEDGKIVVSENSEVGKAMSSNPRTAIGITYDGHYIFIVSDGRTNESKGLSLYELALFAQKFNIKTLYNLDGGGSSSMYFNGNLVNKPTTNGNRINERSVSDIVYIGY